jgi:hypothetical protein
VNPQALLSIQVLTYHQGIVDYLLANQTAYIDEVQAFVEDQYDISVSYETMRRAIKQAHITRKVVCTFI